MRPALKKIRHKQSAEKDRRAGFKAIGKISRHVIPSVTDWPRKERVYEQFLVFKKKYMYTVFLQKISTLQKKCKIEHICTNKKNREEKDHMSYVDRDHQISSRK